MTGIVFRQYRLVNLEIYNIMNYCTVLIDTHYYNAGLLCDQDYYYYREDVIHSQIKIPHVGAAALSKLL